jgi:hypothetical protein
MSRGLSELQIRILSYARYEHSIFTGGAPWFGGVREAYREDIGEAILPGKWGQWTRTDFNSVSRALSRLVARGLIIQTRYGRRTESIVLTPAGEAVLGLIKAGKPVPLWLGKWPKTEAESIVATTWSHQRRL